MTSNLKTKLFFYPIVLLLALHTFTNCKKQPNTIELPDIDDKETEVPILNSFSVNSNYILKNDVPFPIKGIVYVPCYPGYLPWELEQSASLPYNLKQSIDKDMQNIKAMGANTIRFWGAPKYCYESIKKTGDLFFIQTIWINGDQSDFHDTEFKIATKAYIKEVVDRIYSVYPENNPPIIAFLVGNELSEAGIGSTNAAHPEITSYTGNYISASNINPSEAFIAEMADYLKSYELSTYGNQSLVSYSNDIRTADLLDTPFLDFRTHNAYSYSVPEYRPFTQAGSSTATLYQGWIEKLKLAYPNIPLLISEMGLSISPQAAHKGPPNYGYGGNSVLEQAEGILQGLEDIDSSTLPIAGVCIHEYLDAWWKFGLEDSYSQDPYDVEEWFGITQFRELGSWYDTEFRNVYFTIRQYWAN